MTRWNGYALTPLTDIRGQDTARRILLSSFNKRRLASTYLFYGLDGQGKWAMAIALAALVNCEHPVTDDSGVVSDACGTCRNCRQILNYTFPDMYFGLPIPPHKNDTEALELNLDYRNKKKAEPYCIISSTRQLTIPIAFAREIKRRTAIKPETGVTRVILFYQMERMLPGSADSLLKLIEEPPPETVIILTARDPDNLLPTIQSRAQKIRFRPLSDDIIADYLQARHEVDEEKGRFYARLARGSLGRAISLLDDEDQSSLRQVSFLMLKELCLNDTPSAIGTLQEFINPNNRGQLEEILTHWQTFFGDLIVLKHGKTPDSIVNIDLTSELEALTDKFADPDTVSAVVGDLKQLCLSLRRNVHIRPALAGFAVRFHRYLRQSA